MTIRIDAYVLLKRPWKPDFDAIASEFEWRYPQLGKARVRRGKGGDGQGTITVDGAAVEISHVGAPYPAEQMHPPIRTLGHDVEEVARLTMGQSAYVVVTASCEAAGMEWCRAYAALVTLVADVVAAKADALAVMWPDSWACLSPAAFEEAAGAVLRGQVPVNLWVAFAQSNPPVLGGAEMTGIVTLGLRHFMGRELELAPMPSLAGEAIGCMREAVGRLTAGTWMPEDHGTLRLDCYPAPLAVRLCPEGFLRRGVPAAVLIAPEAAVDPQTLARKGTKPQGEGAGLIGRLFRRV